MCWTDDLYAILLKSIQIDSTKTIQTGSIKNIYKSDTAYMWNRFCTNGR